MRKTICGALLLMAAFVAPLQADLKYTMRMDVRRAEAPATPSNPMTAMIGALVVGAIAPEEGMEFTVTVGEAGTRVDYVKAYNIVPAGGATIVRKDGSLVVIDTAKRTYFEMAKPDLAALGGMTPVVTLSRTGEFAEIAGLRAARAKFEIRLPLPKAAAGQRLPVGIPAELVIRGDAWLADQYKNYARLTAGLMGGISGLGFEKLADEGFVVKTVLGGELFGDREVESVVTAVAEVPTTAAVFEVPAGFTRVDPPSGPAALGSLGAPK